MLRYIGLRAANSVLVMLGVSLMVFMMIQMLPGDAVGVMLSEFGASAEQQEALREELGLNDPLIVQYGRFLVNAVQGDLGSSLFTRRPVLDQILTLFPATLELALAATLISVVLGVTFGMLAAARPNSWLDVGTMVLALVWVSMPGFWLALIFLFLFSLRLGWFPAAGTGGVAYLVLPAFALGMRSAGVLARLVRSSMLEVMRSDYITTARAKGLSDRVVRWRHGLRNALMPVVTVVGLQFGSLLGGAVIVEIIFARQGIGDLILRAIFSHDLPLVMGGVLFVAFAFVMMNLIVDIAYAALDPRVRYG